MTVIETQKAIEALKETIGDIKEIRENADLSNRVIECFEKKITDILDSFDTEEGFVDLGKSKAIYVHLDNRGNPPWYIWNSERQERDYINKPKLKGSLRYILLRENQQNQPLSSPPNISKTMGAMGMGGQEIISKKAIIYIECQQREGGKRYGIVAGHTTVFSRQFIWKVHHWIKENKWQGKEFKLSIIPERIVSQTGRSYISCRLFDEKETPLVTQQTPPEDWTENDWDRYLETAVQEINSAIAGNEVAVKAKETEIEAEEEPPVYPDEYRETMSPLGIANFPMPPLGTMEEIEENDKTIDLDNIPF